MTRQDIMNKCPESFEDELKEFIDYVEQEVQSAASEIDNDIAREIHRVDSAYCILSQLETNLY